MSRPTRTLAATLAALALTVPAASLAPAAGAAPSAPSTPSAQSATPSAARATSEMKVMTYNIHFASAGIDKIAADIEKRSPTVVVLNEVNLNLETKKNQARMLAERLGMRWRFMRVERKAWGWRGNAILVDGDSRFVRGSVEKVLLPRNEVYQRGALGARVRTSGTVVQVWATHLHFGDGNVAQSRTLRRTVGRPTCTTYVAGDMNQAPSSAMHRILTRKDWLRDVWEVKGQGNAATGGKRRIDYIFFKKAVALHADVPKRSHSDHRPVIARFRVDDARGC